MRKGAGSAGAAAAGRAAGSPRAVLLWGEEELRKREALEALIAELVPPEERELDVEYLDAAAAGLTAETILHAARDRAMFSGRRVVVVLNAGRLRGARHQRTQVALAEGLRTLPEYATVIFVAYAEEAGGAGGGRGRAPFDEPLMAAIRAVGEVRRFASLKPEELARLAIDTAAAEGKQLARPAATLLAQRVGPDSHRLVQETRKLAAYVGDRPAIGPEEVAAMVPAPPDDNIFRMLEATLQGDRRQAMERLRQLRESGAAAPYVLTMLRRTLRQVIQAKFLQEERVPAAAERDAAPAEARAMLPEEDSLYRNTAAWQRERLWGQARRFTWERLHRALDALAIAEAGTKGWEGGIEDPDLALEVFVMSLAEAARPEAVLRDR